MKEESDPRISRTLEDISLQEPIRSAYVSHIIEDGQASPGSTLDDLNLQSTSGKTFSESNKLDREPMFVIVDSRCVSNPSSKEILINKRDVIKDNLQKRILKNNVIRLDIPCTSKDQTNFTPVQIFNCESREELQMIDINLQSDNEIPVDDQYNDDEQESIVKSYLRNKDILLDKEELLPITRKKSSILENVPVMETIIEGEQFSLFSSSIKIQPLHMELSESSLDVYIPSYPGSPRSLHIGSGLSFDSNQAQNPVLKEAIEFLHEDKDILIAAEIGNDKLLEIYIRRGTDIHQVDHVGRNALHLAVYSGNIKAIKLLLDAGINPNVKDNVGMTPLSLSLMRRPSLLVANLLFDHGAILLPRSDPLDTGLFIQFAMMCKPTLEEEKILRLLVYKGAVINDPNAPGGRQALHFAAMSNNTTLIRLLVSLGADISMTNHRNETPKETAETFKCKEAYELLCEIEEMEEVASSSSNIF